MSDRRPLEDGAARLHEEDGSGRLLEQQPVVELSFAVTEADDTLSASAVLAPISEGVAGGAVRRRRGMPRIQVSQRFTDALRKTELHAALFEDDDVLMARVETLPGRRALNNRRAIAVLLLT